MGLNPLFRILGALLYGIVGYYVGVAFTGIYGLTSASMAGAAAGMAFGYLLAPWLFIAPARAARNSLRSVPIKDLVAATIGLAIGLLIAAMLAYPLSRLPPPFGGVLPLVAVFIFGYLGAMLVVVRQDDIYSLFRLQEEAPEGAETAAALTARAPMFLDTSVIIDGRIADVAETGFILGEMMVPRFVLNELQYIADSSDTLRRNRGRRGLEVLDRLQQNPDVAIEFIDIDPQDAQQVDDKLISLAKQMGGAVVTNDYNLNRVARLQSVTILNINELANAVKAVFLPGEEMPLKIIQEGKEANQGVGYLEDGTMVVVENGRQFVGEDILVEVTKVLQTNAGRLIFATPETKHVH